MCSKNNLLVDLQKIQTTIAPEWSSVNVVHNECSNFLKSIDIKPQSRDAMSIVVSELLANAVKYGSYTKEKNTIDFSLVISNRDIIAKVSNPIRSIDEKNLSNLDKTIQWIRGYHNPFQAYVSRLLRNNSKDLKASERGLGLLRVSYVGESIIDFYLDEANVIHILAVHEM